MVITYGALQKKDFRNAYDTVCIRNFATKDKTREINLTFYWVILNTVK